MEAEAELAEYRKQQAEALAILEKQEAEKRVRTEADKRRSLAKEIEQLERQIQTDLFRQRQALAQKEVEIFRLAGEMRIKQIEKANAKLLEGEEGASRAALESLTITSPPESGESFRSRQPRRHLSLSLQI